MSWGLLACITIVLFFATLSRREELGRLVQRKGERQRARETGSDKARLRYPHVDLSRCLGCGTCIEACPEEGVLQLLHGQAAVVHGARCVGHGRCAEECPVGAIALTMADVRERRDLPAVTDSFESVITPGLFLAGEVTGYALVRTAIGHGTAVANEVANRLEATPAAMPQHGRAGARAVSPPADEVVFDLVVVGAGPAGLACSLEAKRRGLNFVTLEQEQLGGTVSKYPRRKLVMTQPVELPLHGKMERSSYTKEELMELWETVAAEQKLPIWPGEEFKGLETVSDAEFLVHATSGVLRARNVCIAVGRRGTPRKLGIPGEELSKVAYSLLDAHSYTDRKILVVGGGDSAVEAAMGLAEQPGNQVTLSYRKGALFRLKARNQKRVEEALHSGAIQAVFHSELTAVRENEVDLEVSAGEQAGTLTLANDEVFIFAGGIPPFELLEKAGVSFDPALRDKPPVLSESGTGVLPALLAALGFAAVAQGVVLWFYQYYSLPRAQRGSSELHSLLRPTGEAGLLLGVAASVAIFLNLAYLLRRNPRFRFEWGSLRAWMTSHVVTGVLALLFALVHSAMLPGNTVGGHALVGLAVLVATGGLGRYLYAFVPRAANGRELEVDEIQSRVAGLSAEWDQGASDFGQRMQERLTELTTGQVWRASLPRRMLALVGSQRALRRALEDLRREGRAQDVPEDKLEAYLDLARRAHRAAMASAHFEDLRGVLSSWRWIHRWAALLMVLLVLRHVFAALRYSGLLQGVLGR